MLVLMGCICFSMVKMWLKNRNWDARQTADLVKQNLSHIELAIASLGSRILSQVPEDASRDSQYQLKWDMIHS